MAIASHDYGVGKRSKTGRHETSSFETSDGWVSELGLKGGPTSDGSMLETKKQQTYKLKPLNTCPLKKETSSKQRFCRFVVADSSSWSGNPRVDGDLRWFNKRLNLKSCFWERNIPCCL